MTKGARVACIPASGEHSYLQSLYGALSAHDVRVTIDGASFDDAFLQQHRDEFELLHLHWPEHLWGAGRLSKRERLRGVAGFWRFLRTARRLRIPVIWSLHNLQPHEGGDWIDAIGYRLLARHSALVICHDQSARREFLHRYPSAPGDLVVMRLGTSTSTWPIPCNRAATRRLLGLMPSDRLLVCFGLLRPYKGFDIAIEALHHLEPEYRLVIAGEPSIDSHLQALQRRAAASDRVTIIPRKLSDQELVDLLEASDCVLFPYREITGSAALLGALTQRRGVVASDLPFFRDTLQFAPDAGVFCSPGDAAALANAIREFFEVPTEIRGAAAATVAAEHDWQRVVVPVVDWIATHAARTGARA
jgi:glycosyltransferase involved in cell wall biosynthesis